MTFAASANSASRKLDRGCDRTTEQKEEDNILQTEAAAIKRLRINERRRERGKKNQIPNHTKVIPNLYHNLKGVYPLHLPL